MKKLLFILFGLLIFGSSIAQKSDATLTTQATTIRNETQPGANTATRIGNMFLDIINAKQSILATYTATGTNTYSVTVNSAVTTYVAGDLFFIKFTNENTTPASTINVNGIGAKYLVMNVVEDITAGLIKANSIHMILYDGANFQMLTLGGGGGSGSGDMEASVYDPQEIANDAFDRANHTGTQAPSSITGLTSSAAELNILDGATLTVTELNYVDGVTSDIQTQFTAKAPLASPTFTGTPAAPTASPGTNTTQVATTAFVAAAVTAGSVADGDKGDITVSSTGTVWTIDNSAVTNAKINDVAVGKITGLGTGVATALAINVGSAGAPVVLNGAGGTPSSMTGTNITGVNANTGLTGTTLNSSVVTSSITSTGTLTGGATGAGFTVALGTSTITGSLPVANLTAKYILDRATPSTVGGTITLDMNSQIQRMHVGSASFATPKTIALSNTTNSLVFSFSFTVSNVAAVLTMPSDFVMSSISWNGTDWTPPETGNYEIGGSYDGTNWIVKIAGPFN